MKRLLSISFIALILLIGAMGVAPIAHAQTDIGSEAADINQPLTTDQQASQAAAQAETQRILSDPALAQTPTTGKPPTTGPLDWMMIKIMEMFAWLVGVAAIALNYAVYYTVITMGSYVKNLDAIGVTWSIFRDIGNIILIFGFLAAGIATILNVQLYGWGKKMLPMLLVGAVFLNFSLFLSMAVIDTGNLFATQFYSQINNGTVVPPKLTLGSAASAVQYEGISGKIMSQLGFAVIYGGARNGETLKGVDNVLLIGFMSIILFIIAAFVMFTLAFILIARFVMLLYLIIISPIGFAGLAIPKLEATAKWWWSKLFEQTITAPILLLLLYVALAVITDKRFLNGFGFADSANPLGFASTKDLAGFGSFILSFLIAMGLLIMVVIMSKKISAFGAGWASGAAGKLTFGATAWGMRSTVGAGSRLVSQAIRTSRIGGTKTGRILATTFDRGAKASFDARGVTTFGGLKAMGIDAGKAQEGGYSKHREEVIKEHQEYAKSIGAAYDEKKQRIGNDQKVIAEANIVKAKAEFGKKLAEDEKTKIETKVATHKKEVDELEEKKRTDRYWATDPANETKLNAARKNLDSSKIDLVAATTKLAEATKQLNETNKEQNEKIKKATDINLTAEEKKAAQKAYGKNLDGLPVIGSLPGWVIFGPGGPAAARKIIKDAGKTEKDKFYEQMQKAIEENKGSDHKEPEKPAVSEQASPDSAKDAH